MLIPAAVSLLGGMALAQRFKVLILAPTILLTLFMAIGVWAGRGDASSAVGLTAVVIIVDLQIGYVLGIIFRHLALVARASRLHPMPVANSRHERSAH
jgi:hypothetical protein